MPYKMIQKTFLMAALLLATLLATITPAVDPPASPPPGTLSLRIAIAKALATRPEIAAADQELLAARDHEAVKRRAILPELSVGLNAWRRSGQGGVADFISATGTREYDYRVLAESTLWGGPRSGERRAALAQRESREAQLIKTRAELGEQVAIAYYSEQTAEADSLALEDSVAALSHYREMTQARLTHGAAAQIELSRAESRLAAEQARLLDRRTEADRLRAQLAALTGLPEREIAPEPALDLEEATWLTGDPAPARPGTEPALLVAQAAARQAAGESMAERSNRLPRLSVSASYGIDAEQIAGAPRGYQVGASLNIPIDVFGKQRLNFSESTATATAAQLRADATQLQLSSEEQNALRVVRSARSRYRLLIAALAGADRSQEIAAKAYALGGMSALEVLDANQQRTDLRLGLHEARLTGELALVHLRALLGLAVEGD